MCVCVCVCVCVCLFVCVCVSVHMLVCVLVWASGVSCVFFCGYGDSLKNCETKMLIKNASVAMNSGSLELSKIINRCTKRCKQVMCDPVLLGLICIHIYIYI